MMHPIYNRHHLRSGSAHNGVRIPREFRALVAQFTIDSIEQMELWWYALALLMLDQKQVSLAGQREVAGRAWITLRLDGDNEFDIVRPYLTAEMEVRLREGVRQMVARQRRRNLN